MSTSISTITTGAEASVGVPLGYGTTGVGVELASAGAGTTLGDGIAGTVGAGAVASVGAAAGAGITGAGEAMEHGAHRTDTITASITLATVGEIMHTTNPEEGIPVTPML